VLRYKILKSLDLLLTLLLLYPSLNLLLYFSHFASIYAFLFSLLGIHLCVRCMFSCLCFIGLILAYFVCLNSRACRFYERIFSYYYLSLIRGTRWFGSYTIISLSSHPLMCIIVIFLLVILLYPFEWECVFCSHYHLPFYSLLTILVLDCVWWWW